jgi:CPA1 family monovalent cation:H+ antiporter
VVTFELILSMLLVGALAAAAARRLKIPYPVLLAGFGAALAFAPRVPDLTIPPDLVLALFVAPVLLDAAYDASLRDLRDNWRPVAGLAIVAVILTTACVAIVARWLVPDLPWPVAVALGALVAPPDASAATAVLSELRPPHRVLVILEGESLFNDASALLIYRAAVGVVMTGKLYSAIPGLAFAAIGSAVLGLVLGRLFMVVTERLQHVATAILMQFLSVFLVWILAERLGLSGIITLVCFAIMVAQIAPIQTHPRLRIPSYAVWEVVVFVLNLMVFMLVGLQLKPLLQRLNPTEVNSYLAVGAAVCATTILVRIAWVMTYNTIVRWKNHRFGARLPRPMMLPTLQGGMIISWCGMRGIVTLAAALALPDGSNGTPLFPYRNLLLFSAFCVVLGTLIIQGLTLRPLLFALEVKEDETVDREANLARTVAAKAALRALDDQPASMARAVVRREYEARLRRMTSGEPAPDDESASELGRVQQCAILAERSALSDMRARGEIGDDAFHRVEEELDWAEMHVARQSGSE